MRSYYPGGSLNALASPQKGSILPKAREHRLGRGLPGYLIPFATHAFVSQRQQTPSILLSLLAFYRVSTDFTPTHGIPDASELLEIDSFHDAMGVELPPFTAD